MKKLNPTHNNVGNKIIPAVEIHAVIPKEEAEGVELSTTKRKPRLNGRAVTLSASMPK